MAATAESVVVELRPNLAQLCRECLEGAGGDRDKAAVVLSDRVLNDPAARAAFFDSAILYWAREIIIRETGKERAAIYAQQARMPVTDGSTFRAAVVENARRFMEIPLWGGKPIGFATAAEIRASAAEHRKQAKTYGERAAWQVAVADALEKNGTSESTVRDCLTEATLERLWCEVKDV